MLYLGAREPRLWTGLKDVESVEDEFIRVWAKIIDSMTPLVPPEAATRGIWRCLIYTGTVHCL